MTGRSRLVRRAPYPRKQTDPGVSRLVARGRNSSCPSSPWRATPLDELPWFHREFLTPANAL